MNRSSIIVFLGVIFSFVSCTNQSVQLPQIPISGVSDIQNHSELWVFYKEKDGKIEAHLNKNNRINSTHWIINIDKRLTLKVLVPVFKIIKEKRELKSIHKKEGMKNYLSYSDIKDKKIALFAMDSLYFSMNSKDKTDPLNALNKNSHRLFFSKETIEIDTHKFPIQDWETIRLDTLTKESMQLLFSQDLNYQEYLEYRMSINNKLPKKISINKLEYVIQ